MSSRLGVNRDREIRVEFLYNMRRTPYTKDKRKTNWLQGVIMIAIIALLLSLFTLVNHSDVDVVMVSAVITEHEVHGCTCDSWNCYYVEAYEDAESEFDAIFNSLTYKRSSNGRSMVNGKFVKMGA